MHSLLPVLIMLVPLVACSKEPRESSTRPSPARPDDAPSAREPAPRPCTAVDIDALDAGFAAGHATFTQGDWRLRSADAADPDVDRARAPQFAPLFRQVGLVEAAERVGVALATNASNVYDCIAKRQNASLELGETHAIMTVDCTSGPPDSDFGGTVDALVIARAAPDGWCLVHASARTGYSADRPCHAKLPPGVTGRTITPIPLVATGRDALREDDYDGFCGNGPVRYDKVSTAFYGLEGGELVEYFRGTISSLAEERHCPELQGDTGVVTLGDSFPRTITYQATRECFEGSDCLTSPDCRPAKGTELWTYADGRYTRQGAAALTPMEQP